MWCNLPNKFVATKITNFTQINTIILGSTFIMPNFDMAVIRNFSQLFSAFLKRVIFANYRTR